VRPLIIVNLEEVIEPALLLQEVEGSGFSGFFLQGQVHAFVASILLGVPWPNALDVYTQAQPPHRESAQAEQGIGTREWHTVVGTDGPG
jgi:hypothetical protein